MIVSWLWYLAPLAVSLLGLVIYLAARTCQQPEKKAFHPAAENGCARVAAHDTTPEWGERSRVHQATQCLQRDSDSLWWIGTRGKMHVTQTDVTPSERKELMT